MPMKKAVGDSSVSASAAFWQITRSFCLGTVTSATKVER